MNLNNFNGCLNFTVLDCFTKYSKKDFYLKIRITVLALYSFLLTVEFTTAKGPKELINSNKQKKNEFQEFFDQIKMVNVKDEKELFSILPEIDCNSISEMLFWVSSCF